MAKDRSDGFSYAELALAAGISRSAFQFLDRAHFLPGDRSIRDFKRLAVIGAFMAAGLPMVTAASIAKTFVTMEINQYDGEVPSGLESLLTESIENLERDAWVNNPANNDYWYHRA